MILLLLALLQCDPNRPGLTYGWNESWVFRAESLDGEGMPSEGTACWAIEVLDWPTYCIERGGPGRLAPRECIVRDTDRDGDYDLMDYVEERR